jgi:GAF domain-containing protein
MDDKRRPVQDDAARLQRSLQTVSRCNRELFQARGEPELLQSICQILVETAQVDVAWIGYCEDDDEQTVRPVASAGNGADYLERVHHSWGPMHAGQGPVGEAIRTGNCCWVKDIRTDPIFSHARAEALARGYLSCVAFPLVADTPREGWLDLRGALTLYARTPDSLDESEIGLYAELASHLACTIGSLRSHLADDLSDGVSALLIRGERKRVQEALQSSEDRLRLVINSVTPDGQRRFSDCMSDTHVCRTHSINRRCSGSRISVTKPSSPLAKSADVDARFCRSVSHTQPPFPAGLQFAT